MFFAAARNDDELTIDVFDVVGRDFWGDGITAKSVQRVLSQNDDAKRILVRINSPGGDVFEGTAIFNLLRQHRAKVRVQIIGLAASMASILALAGDHVSMADNALFMIHDPWVFAIGTGDDLRKTAGLLDKVKANLLNVYEGKANLDRDEIAALMTEETWLSAREAKEAGFIDEIIPVSDEPDTDGDAKARARAVLAKFERTPDTALARYHEPLVAAMATAPKDVQGDTMERDKIIALLGLPKDATDEDIERALKPIELPAATSLVDAVPRADYDAVRAKLDALQAQAKKDAQEQFEATVDRELDDAIKAGRITPASRDYHRKSCLARKEEGLEEFRAYAKAQPELAGDGQMARAEQHRGGAVAAQASEDERKVCRMLGISTDELSATRKAIADDPENYPPEAYRFAI